jgi:hypothetical protein
MKKPVSVLIFTFVFAACALGYLYRIGTKTNPMLFPQKHHARRLAMLDRQLERLAGEPGPRRIIVGPSYAGGLFGLDGSVNLATGGMRPFESIAVIRKYCNESDLIIYPVAPYTLLYWDSPVRPEMTNKYLRRLEIGRAAIKQFVTIQYSADSVHEKTRDVVLKSQINRVKKAGCDIDMTPFVELSRDFPHLLFVLYPRFDGGERYTQVDSQFRSLFSKNDIRHLDLADLLSNDSFNDAWHATFPGNALIRERISRATRM